ncbi:MAG: hypothetical protein JOZ47_07735 [Kutzneria sp.]|nr:hypothetical protein [Kutzneria sp.]MBV9844947.1 hypothetical protein [Kutzneria sp.]
MLQLCPVPFLRKLRMLPVRRRGNAVLACSHPDHAAVLRATEQFDVYL